MKTSVERVDETTVKLRVTVPAKQVDAAINAAAAELAGSVKVPGFRPGRVPRKVLESRFGKDAVVQEAVRDSLPGFYSEAVHAEDLDVVSNPEFDVEEFTDGKDATFTATVQVRPEFELPDLTDLQVPHPDWELTDDEVDEQLDAMRERFAELETVERAAEVGDFLRITLVGRRDGEVVEEAGAEDLLYELHDPDASESALDRALVGTSAGDTVEFADSLGPGAGEDLAGQELAFTAEVAEVKVKRLPALDDDFALTASEFDTIEELREDLRSQLARQKRVQARAALRGRVVEAVTELVDVPLPASLVDNEVGFRLNRIAQEAEQYGFGLDDYLRAVGQDAEELSADLRQQAAQTVKAQLVIDAVGEDAGIEVTREDLGEEIGRQAARLGRPPQELAEFMTHPDRIGALVTDSFRRRAIDHLLEVVEVTGAPPPEEEPVAVPEDAEGEQAPGDETPDDEASGDQTSDDEASGDQTSDDEASGEETSGEETSDDAVQ